MKITIENSWVPEKIWDGDRAFILGGGPGLKLFDLDKIHNEHVIGVNNSFLLGDWVDVGWFGDKKWLKWHRKKFMEFKGLRASCNRDYELIEENHDWIHFMVRGKAMGIDEEPGKISWNKCSGSSAINLAYHLGAKSIVLVGFDMHDVNGQKNWHADHKDDGIALYKKFLMCYRLISEDAKRLGIELLNATPGSAIKEIPIIDPQEGWL